MIATTLMLASVLLAAEPEREPLVPREFINLFEAHDYQLPKEIEKTKTEVIHYRLFVPRNLKSNERCPMIVWLHGMNEGGSENHYNLRYLPLVLKDTKQIEQYRFFILLPQCPSTQTSWTSPLGVQPTKNQTVDMLTITYDLIQKTIQDQPIDPDRVSLLGICSGGNGAWEMGIRHPELFSAISLFVPGGGDVSQAARLAGVPVWVFQTKEGDWSSTQQMVDAVKQSGGNIHFSLLHSNGHNCWSTAIRNGIVEWMLSQQCNAWVCWTPPGYRLWRWWHVFGVPLSCSLILGLGWWGKRRSHRQKTQAAGRESMSAKSDSNKSDN